MALLIKEGSVSHAWRALITSLFQIGVSSSPRGKRTIEIMNVSVEVKKALNNIILSPSRDLNYRFMIAEWLWIQAGLNELSYLIRYNSVMKDFSDDGQILSGAYGPRLRPQLFYILESLRKQDSRQAVATIWTPSPSTSLDVPCTISLQWLIREGALHVTVNMRSSDVWLGFPYDFFTFTQYTNVVASYLNLPVGSITMNLASSHLYEINIQNAMALLMSEDANYHYSPTITNIFPGKHVMSNILLRKEPTASLQEPWKSYATALEQDKHSALEVLLELPNKINKS
jgi:thymidylate synthase